MKKLLLAGIAVAALYSAPVLAAPPAAPMFNWTGFYAGGSIGGRWADPVWTTTCLTPPPVAACFDPARLAFNNPASFKSTALRGGIYGGYNWQLSPMWVVGIESDVGFARSRRTIADIPGAEAAGVAFAPGDTSTVKESWDTGIRGRLGYLINPNLLLFGTGGATWTKMEASAFCGTPFAAGGFCTPGFAFFGTTSTLSKTLTGWTAGGGLEWMLAPQWLVRGEYRYADYGKLSGTFFPGFNGACINCEAIAAEVKLKTHTALFGIAYRFGR